MSTGTHSTDYVATAKIVRPLADWRKQALCAGRYALFDAHDKASEKAALALCNLCPVLKQCQPWVMRLTETLDPGGTCGGLTEEQRTKVRRRHGRVKRCTDCGQEKRRSQFNRSGASIDGLAGHCILCGAARASRRRRAENSEVAACG